MLEEKKSRALCNVSRILDMAWLTFAFVASFFLREAIGGGEPLKLWSHLTLLPVILILSVLCLTYFGGYASPRTTSLTLYAWAVLRGVVFALAILMAFLFLFKIQYLSRVVMGIFTPLSVLGLIGVRALSLWYVRRSARGGESFHRILIIGSGNRATRLAATLLRNSEWGVHIVGFLDPDPARIGQHVSYAPVLGSVDQITSVLKRYVVDEVILAIPRTLIPNGERIARACEEEGVRFLLMADMFDVHVARMRLTQFNAIPLLTFEPVAQEEWSLLLKRTLDLVFTLCALPVFLPLMAAIALAIKLDSRGRVFFVQTRVGKNKRRFPMLKFRTMIEGSEQLQATLEHLNEAKGPIFKIANDPRITRIGRILRRTSLDELPQIFNVLRGDMSLVGPRPMSLRDVSLFDQGIQRKRFSVKPGLTCLWQVSGRSQLPFSKWLELDLQYIDTWSLGLDLRILFKTIPAVLKGSGAV